MQKLVAMCRSIHIHAGVGMNILNTEFFGYIMPPKGYRDINEASRDFFQLKLKTLGKKIRITKLSDIHSLSSLKFCCKVLDLKALCQYMRTRCY